MDELEKQLMKLDAEAFKKLIPEMPHKINPIYNKLVENTPLAEARYSDGAKMSNIIDKAYLKKWRDFRHAWINIFGGTDINPLKGNPMDYINKYMSDSFKDKSKGSRKGYAEKWLSDTYQAEKKL